MDLVIVDKDGREVKILKNYSLDIDLADEMDFSIATEKKAALDMDIDYMWYIPGTEYGGIVDEITVKTEAGNNDTVTYAGRSWRGLLNSYIYVGRVDSYADNLFERLLNKIFETLGVVDLFGIDKEYKSRSFSKSYTSNLYPTLLELILSIAESEDLNIHLEMKVDGTAKLYIGFIEKKTLSAPLTSDLSYYYEAIKKPMGVNHLICLGSGTYPNRTTLHLYADESGNISTTQSYGITRERAELYDYANAEDSDDLEENGREKLAELVEKSSITLTLGDGDYNIGDTVVGYDELTDLTVESTVNNIIFKLETNSDGETASTEFKVE